MFIIHQVYSILLKHQEWLREWERTTRRTFALKTNSYHHQWVWLIIKSLFSLLPPCFLCRLLFLSPSSTSLSPVAHPVLDHLSGSWAPPLFSLSSHHFLIHWSYLPALSHAQKFLCHLFRFTWISSAFCHLSPHTPRYSQQDMQFLRFSIFITNARETNSLK